MLTRKTAFSWVSLKGINAKEVESICKIHPWQNNVKIVECISNNLKYLIKHRKCLVPQCFQTYSFSGYPKSLARSVGACVKNPTCTMYLFEEKRVSKYDGKGKVMNKHLHI